MAYKNIFDWASRINPRVFQNKAMMLAISPDPGDAASVLAAAIASAPYFNGNVITSLSAPSFYENYDVELGRVRNDEIDTQLSTVMNSLL